MSILQVLIVVVCLVFGLETTDIAVVSRPPRWSAHNQAGIAALDRGDYAGAIREFSESVDLATTRAERATSLTSYGTALARVGRNAEARPALERALTVLVDTPGKERAAVSRALATVDRALGDYQCAEGVLRAALAEPLDDTGSRIALANQLADLLRHEASPRA